MNAQELINETPVSHFDWKVFWKSQSSKVNNLPHSEQKGDKSFARMQSKTAQARLNKGFTPLLNTKEPNNSLSLEAPLNHPLKRTTLNYSKLNETRRNLEWQQAEKELGLIQL